MRNLGFEEMALGYFSHPHTNIREEPIEHPAAWTAAALADTNTWTLILDDGDVAELNGALAAWRETSKATSELTAEAFPLPYLENKIRAWTREVDEGRGFVRVRGLPAERYNEEELATLFWGIGCHMGTPGRQNAKGDLIGKVTDSGAKTADEFVRAYETADHIAFHVDLADIVGLLCVRPATEGGESRIASSVAVYNEILTRRPDLIGTMYEPFPVDRRNEERPGEAPFIAVPLARYSDDRLSTFYHSDYLRSASRHSSAPKLSTEQRELLDLYETIANSPEFYLDMNLEAGDMQFLSNHTVVHSRTAYLDSGETDRRRLLLRLWISTKSY